MDARDISPGGLRLRMAPTPCGAPLPGWIAAGLGAAGPDGDGAAVALEPGLDLPRDARLVVGYRPCAAALAQAAAEGGASPGALPGASSGALPGVLSGAPDGAPSGVLSGAVASWERSAEALLAECHRLSGRMFCVDVLAAAADPEGLWRALGDWLGSDVVVPPLDAPYPQAPHVETPPPETPPPETPVGPLGGAPLPAALAALAVPPRARRLSRELAAAGFGAAEPPADPDAALAAWQTLCAERDLLRDQVTETQIRFEAYVQTREAPALWGPPPMPGAPAGPGAPAARGGPAPGPLAALRRVAARRLPRRG